MRNAILVVAVALVGVSACSKDDEARAFVKENDALLAEIKRSPDVQTARKAFDGKRGALKAKLTELKAARGWELEEESTKAVEKSLMDGVSTTCGLEHGAAGRDADTQYKALCDDYASLIGD